MSDTPSDAAGLAERLEALIRAYEYGLPGTVFKERAAFSIAHRVYDSREILRRALAITAEVDRRAALPHLHSDYNGKHSAEGIIRSVERGLQ